MPRPARLWHKLPPDALQRVQFMVRAGVMARVTEVVHDYSEIPGLNRDTVIDECLEGCLDLYVDAVLKPRLSRLKDAS